MLRPENREKPPAEFICTGCRFLVHFLVDQYDLHAFTLDLELCAGQRLVLILAVDLGELDAGDIGLGFRFRSFAGRSTFARFIRVLGIALAVNIRVVGISQLDFVGVASNGVKAGVLIQGSGIGDKDGVSFCIVDEIFDDNFNCRDTGRICIVCNRVFVGAKRGTANRDCNVIIEGQALGHGIVQNKEILGVARHIRNSGLDFIVDNVADGSVVCLDAGVALFDVLVNSRDVGLSVHGDIMDDLKDVAGIGVRTRRGIILVLDEVVAGGQRRDAVIRARLIPSRSSSNSSVEVCTSQLGKLLRFFSIASIRCEHISNLCGGRAVFKIIAKRRVSFQRCQQSSAVYAAAPFDVGENGFAVLFGQIAGKNLIGFICVAGRCIVDRNRVCSVVCREYCRAHRQQQGQRQHEGERAFYCFHGLVLPFAFCFFTFIQL